MLAYTLLIHSCGTRKNFVVQVWNVINTKFSNNSAVEDGGGEMVVGF